MAPVNSVIYRLHTETPSVFIHPLLEQERLSAECIRTVVSTEAVIQRPPTSALRSVLYKGRTFVRFRSTALIGSTVSVRMAVPWS